MATRFNSILLIALLLVIPAFAEPSLECGTADHSECHVRAQALRLKLIAIAVILVAGMAGICLLVFSRSVPWLGPDKNLFVLIKAFAAGVILATGYMHVLPDSFEELSSPCLPENPWKKFPFTTFVAMMAAITTLMMESLTMAVHGKKHVCGRTMGEDHERPSNEDGRESGKEKSILLHNRIVAQILEMGIMVHSVVIGLSIGASESPCIIRPLVVAICFHQLFEGMGLGGCLLQAEYGKKMKAVMVFFFSVTAPFGIVLGIALSKLYSDDSPTALVVEGLLNAFSAGLLNYMALVDLLAADFMGPKLQGSIKLQLWAFSAVLLGVGAMSLLAKWT